MRKCEQCNTLLDKEGKCKCGKFYVSDKKCPECGALTFTYSNERDDSTLGTYCTNTDCSYVENQYMTWDDIKETVFGVYI